MPKRLSAESKIKLIQRVRSGEDVSKVCLDAGISRTIFYKWLKKYNSDTNGTKLSTLKSNIVKSKEHWKALSPETEREIVKIALQNPDLSIRDIAKEVSIGIHGVWNVLKRHSLNTEQSRRSYINSYGKSLVKSKSTVDKLTMIRRFEAGESISSICKEFNISRTVFYRWLKRYQEAAEDNKKEVLQNQRPKGENHWRFIQGEYEEAILAAVRLYPELSSHKLVWALPQVGGTPIASNHGVQNVLERNSLTTYDLRLAYSRAYYKPTASSRFFDVMQRILAGVVTRDEVSRKIAVKGTLIATLGTFFGIALVGLVSLGKLILGAGSFTYSIGIIFSLIALTFGMFFFLYSLKYYFTIATVLSYSRKGSKKGSQNDDQAETFLAKIFSKFTDKNKEYSGGGGLQQDLSGVVLDRKPFVSIHLATYNEKRVIERLLAAATSMEYDNYEVILADDSTDDTLELLKKWQDHPRLKIVHRDIRTGYKGAALAAALLQTDPRAEFILVFDADFIPYPDTITQFVKYFKSTIGSLDPAKIKANNIGAVQGYQWHVLNKSENWVTRGVRSEYAGSYVVERSGIEIYSGLKQIAGSVYMIRKDVLSDIGWGTSITEDFQLTLKLYEKGYKVVYTPYIQAPAEAVSTVKRMIRQRMRWAEGHSFNVKKMFFNLMGSKKLTRSEKFEFVYLAPYYLQAAFFIFGTLSWFLAEVVFQAHLPFWTAVWGWSLILTNMLALPLVNMVGLFLEESDQKDYLGLFSFVALSYIVAPFQAYASIKGFIEAEEGPWFRTPKTGRITDVFTPGRFFRFVSGIFGVKGKSSEFRMQSSELGTASSYSSVIENHVQKLEDGEWEMDDDGNDVILGSEGRATPESDPGQARMTLGRLGLGKDIFHLIINWLRERLGFEPKYQVTPIELRSAFNNFSQFRGSRQSNRLIGRAILVCFLIATIAINNATFLTQYDIDWSNFKIKAKDSGPASQRGEQARMTSVGGPQGGPQGGPASDPLIDPAIEQQINIIDQVYSTASTSYVPTDNSLGLVCWNNDANSCGITTGQYTGATVYFEAVIKNLSGGTTTVGLYDSSGNLVTNSEVTTTSATYSRVRTTSALSLTTNTNYTVRVKASSGTAFVNAARIIVLQQDLVLLTDTQTHIEVGNNESTVSMDKTHILGAPKLWKYTSTNYDGTVNIYFEATLKTDNASWPAHAFLFDKTTGTVVSGSDITTSSTSWTLVHSSALTLTSTDTYEVGLYATNPNILAYMATAKVIVTQNASAGITAMELYHQYFNTQYIQNPASVGTFATTSQGQLLQVLRGVTAQATTIGSSTYVYTFGGDSSGTKRSTVYKSTINGNTGDIGAFATTSQGQLLTSVGWTSSNQAVIGSSTYIYTLGGDIGGTAQSTVYKSTINGNTGDLGTFATTSQSQLIWITAYNNTNTATIGSSTYLYVLGGYGGTSCCVYLSSVYKATLNGTTGDAGVFATTSQVQLPLTSAFHGSNTLSVGPSTYIYIIGGDGDTGERTTVYKATINGNTGDIGAFATTSQGQLVKGGRIMPGSSLVNIGPSTYLYAISGSISNVAQSTVYKATVNSSTGDIGTFSTTAQFQMPEARFHFGLLSSLIGSSTYLYILGGDNASGTTTSTVYKANISNDWDSYGYFNLYDSNNFVGGTFTYYNELTERTNVSGSTATGRIIPGNLGPATSTTTALTIGDVGSFATTSQSQLITADSQHISNMATIGSSTYVYVLGGNGAANYSTVYKSTINGTTGDAGAFSTTSQAQLPQIISTYPSSNTSTIGSSTYLYVIGGFNGGTSATLSTVYKSTINGNTGDIGAFATTSQSQLLGTMYLHTSSTSTIGSSSYLYVLGAFSGGNYYSTVYKSTINGNTGDIGAFATTSQSQLLANRCCGISQALTIGSSTYIYFIGGQTTGGGVLSTVYKSTINGNTGDLGAFATTSQGQAPTNHQYGSSNITIIGQSTYLYLIAGHNGSADISTVYKSTINGNNGDIGIFSTTSQAQMLRIMSGLASISYSGSFGGSTYLYVLGGGSGSTVYKSTLGGDPYDLVRSASITPGDNANAGDVGTFATTSQGQLITVAGQGISTATTIGSSTYLYTLGGNNGGGLSTVYKSTVSSNTGDLGSFATTSQAQLRVTQWDFTGLTATIGSSTYIYTLGGYIGSTVSTIYKSTINSNTGDIGTFATTSQGQLPKILLALSSNTATIGSSTYVYAIAGRNDTGGSVQSTIYKSTVNGNTGDLGSFATTSQAQLPAVTHYLSSNTSTIGSSTYLYVFGGNNGSTNVSTVYKSTINGNTGDIGAFATTSQGQLVVAVSELSTVKSVIGSSTYMYVLGGTNGSAYQSTVYKSTVNGNTGDLSIFATTTQAQLKSILGDFPVNVATVGSSTYMYILGGWNGSPDYVSTVYKATLGGHPINGVGGDVRTFATTSQGQLIQSNQSLSSNNATIGSSTYIYVLGGLNGGTVYSTVYKSTLNSIIGDLGAFATTSQSQLPVAMYQHSSNTQTIGSSSYLYVLGGYNGSSALSTVYISTLGGSSGDLGSFATTSQGQLPSLRMLHSSNTSTIGSSSYLYVIGGSANASMAPTGDIGAFATTSQGQLIATTSQHASNMATIGSSTYLYVLGGNGGANYSSVYKSTINGNTGDAGAFATTSQGQLLQIISTFPSSNTTTIGSSTYLYVIGGFNGGTSATLSTVYKSTINGNTGDLGTFATTSQSQLLGTIYLHTSSTSTIGSSSYLYVLGGYFSGNYYSTVYKSTINGNTGDLGAFATTSQAQYLQVLSSSVSNMVTVGSSTYLYIFGGQSTAGALKSTVYKSTLNGNTGDVGAFATTNQAQLITNFQYGSSNISIIGPSTYLYILQGDNSGNLSTVYKSTINGNTGDIGAFATTSQAQSPAVGSGNSQVSYSTTVGASTYLYLIGASASTVYKSTLNSGGPSSTVYKSTTNGNTGDAGSFATTSQGQLPQLIAGHSSNTTAIGSSTYLYVLGGNNGSVISTVYKSTVNGTTGDAGAFATTSQAQLLVALANQTSTTAAIGSSTYLYVLGGATSYLTTAGDLGTFSSTSQSQLINTTQGLSSNTANIGASTYIYALGGDTINAGTGSDGAVTFSSDTNINTANTISGRSCADGGDAVNYSSTANTAAASTTIVLSSTPSSGCLAAGDEVLIINLMGTSGDNSNVGKYETKTISSISTATLTFAAGLINGYDGTTQKIMVQRIPNYTNVTLSNSGTDLTPTAFNGTKGGVMMFRASGTVTVASGTTINANSGGYRGGAKGAAAGGNGTSGESYLGAGTTSTSANGGGGGGGGPGNLCDGRNTGDGGGGGGYGAAGSAGSQGEIQVCADGGSPGDAGAAYGAAALSTLYFGSGGGGGGAIYVDGGAGGNGGGIVVIGANTLTVSGTVSATGGNGAQGAPSDGAGGGGGSGAGGSILIQAATATLGSSLVTAAAGTAGAGGDGSAHDGGAGGTGAVGRIAINYFVTTGSTSPSANTTLVGNVYKATRNGTTGDIGTFATTSQSQLAHNSFNHTSHTTTVGSSTYLYVLGGKSDTTLLFSTVYKSTINGTTGDIGSFATTSQSQLLQTLHSHSSNINAIGASTYVYVLGGTTGSVQSTVYKSTVGGNTGDLGAFATTSQSQLVAAISNHSSNMATVGSSTYIYVLGGAGSTTTVSGGTGDAGAFSSTSQAQLPAALLDASSQTTTIGSSTYLYVLGGLVSGCCYMSTVYKSTINGNTGDAGAFATTSQGQLPATEYLGTSSIATIGSSSYIYQLGGYNGSGLSTAYKTTINSNTGDLGGFATTSQAQLEKNYYYHSSQTATIGSSTYIYTFGGLSSGAVISSVYKTTISSNNGNLGTFATTSQAQLPAALYWTSAASATFGSSTYIYVLAGTNVSAASVSTFYKSTINGNTGDIGTFSTTNQAQLIKAKSRQTNATNVAVIGPSTYLYVIGGLNSATFDSTVYKSTLNGNTGDAGTFSTTSQGQLPVTTSEFTTTTATIGTSTYIFTFGYWDGSGHSAVYRTVLNSTATDAQSTVYKSTVGSSTGDLGAFATTSQAQLPQLLKSHVSNTVMIGASTYIYVAGGLNGSSQSTVYKSTINGNNGDLGAFATTSQLQLPQVLYDYTSNIDNVGQSTYMYILGGSNGSAVSTVYKSTLTPSAVTVSTVYKSTLNSTTGDAGAFATTTQSQLVNILGYHTMQTATLGSSTYLYVIGGTNSGNQSTAYKAALSPNGAVVGEYDEQIQSANANNAWLVINVASLATPENLLVLLPFGLLLPKLVRKLRERGVKGVLVGLMDSLKRKVESARRKTIKLLNCYIAKLLKRHG